MSKENNIAFDYPFSGRFKINKDLPKFKYGCNIRTKLLRDYVQTFIDKGIDRSPNHHVHDYIVEEIIETKHGERWIVGS